VDENRQQWYYCAGVLRVLKLILTSPLVICHMGTARVENPFPLLPAMHYVGRNNTMINLLFFLFESTEKVKFLPLHCMSTNPDFWLHRHSWQFNDHSGLIFTKLLPK
jgi:hypothetical protein